MGEDAPKATIDGQATPALTAVKRADTAGRLWAHGNYKAALNADPTITNRSTGIAKAAAMAFRDKQYEAILKGNPAPAKAAAGSA